jgi:hypothetical protein
VTATPPSATVGPRPGQPGFIGATTHEERVGSVRQQSQRRRRSPLGWLPWALLAALLALLLLMALAGLLVGRGSGSAGSSTTAAAGTGTGGNGTLVSDGNDLLAGDAGLDKLRDLNGKAVTGHDVLVQSVVADEGFWVGRSTADRAFVYLAPSARKGDGESPFQVRAGQHIDLDGTVGILGPNGPARLGVNDVEGARQLAAQKGYVIAKTVRLSS